MIKKEVFSLLILFIFIFLTSKALLHKGFYRTVDDVTTVRIEYLKKELVRKEWLNNFPVRLSAELSNNYGYPLYIFYAPLVYYSGALMMLLGFSHIVATKYVYIFPLLFGPLAFYWASRQKLKNFPALIASIFFTLFPYRGYNTYFRGDAPEAWAISFIPLVFGGLFLLESGHIFGGIIFALSLFLVIFSHQLTGMMVLGLVIVYGLLFFRKNKYFWHYLILSLGLTTFYLLPLIWYLKIIKVTYLKENTGWILNSLAPLIEIVKIKIPFNADYKYPGIIFYILTGGLCFFYFQKKEKSSGTKLFYFFWGGIGLVFYLLLFKPFVFIWKITLPITGILQFSWRLLSLLTFIVPFFLGLLIMNIKKLYVKFTIALLTVIISLTFIPVFKPLEYSYFYDYKPEGVCASTSHQDEFLPIWVKKCPGKNLVLETIPKTSINIIKDNSLTIQAQIINNKNTQLLINKYYFPGWQVLVNGKKSQLNYHFSDYGIFKTQLPPGKHKILVTYQKTLVMWVADFISLISWSILIFLIIKISLFQKLHRRFTRSSLHHKNDRD
jgi:predicted acetyltransferase